MPKSGIETCREIMALFKAAGAKEGSVLKPKAFDEAIGQQAGIDNRTMCKYRKALQEFGFVRKDKHGHPVVLKF